VLRFGPIYSKEIKMPIEFLIHLLKELIVKEEAKIELFLVFQAKFSD
jgi:hypothetical protein